ncbi:MAG TPA: hypothetical protein VGC27_11215 [Rhizomicrobium sp.]
MNTIFDTRTFAKRNTIVVHDVGNCVKSWGLRGILLGGSFGFVAVAILVALPLTTEVLTFGTIGTLIVGTIECAVVGGGFGVLAAALFGQGVLRRKTTGLARTLATDHQSAGADWPEGRIPLSEWPVRWSFPGASVTHSVLPILGDDWPTDAPLEQHDQKQINVIDIWENGSYGP